MTPSIHDQSLAFLLERDLTRQYGPLLATEALRVVLGYPTKDALRQAIVRQTVPIPVFDIENRKGKFALTKDAANWLASQRDKAISERKDPTK